MDLSLLNEGRELTNTLIDAMYSQVRESFGHKPRTHRKQARQQFQAAVPRGGQKNALEFSRSAKRSSSSLGTLSVILPASIPSQPVVQVFWRLSGMPITSCLLSASWFAKRIFFITQIPEVFPLASSAFTTHTSGQLLAARRVAMLSSAPTPHFLSPVKDSLSWIASALTPTTKDKT